MQLYVFPQMAGGLVAVGAVFAGFDLALLCDKPAKIRDKFIEVHKNIRLGCHILGLILAVRFALPELDISPQMVGHLDAAVA